MAFKTSKEKIIGDLNKQGGQLLQGTGSYNQGMTVVL